MGPQALRAKRFVRMTDADSAEIDEVLDGREFSEWARPVLMDQVRREKAKKR